MWMGLLEDTKQKHKVSRDALKREVSEIHCRCWNEDIIYNSQMYRCCCSKICTNVSVQILVTWCFLHRFIYMYMYIHPLTQLWFTDLEGLPIAFSLIPSPQPSKGSFGDMISFIGFAVQSHYNHISNCWQWRHWYVHVHMYIGIA